MGLLYQVIQVERSLIKWKVECIWFINVGVNVK